MAINPISSGSSLFILTQLDVQSRAISRASERIATGFRINRAADDPAGIGMVAKFLGQLGGLNSAQTNVQMGISMVQTAEAGLTTIQDATVRINELTIEAQNGTLSPLELTAIADELVELKETIADAASDTKFNTQQVLAGGSVSIQNGPNAGQTFDIDLPDVGNMASIDALNDAIDDLVDDITNNNGANAVALAGTVQTAASDASSDVLAATSDVGAIENRLDSSMNVLSAMELATSGALSQIRDADVAAEAVELANQELRQEASILLLANLKTQSSLVLKLLE